MLPQPCISLENKIKNEASRLGFSNCGIARMESLENLRPWYSQYLQEKRHLPFQYLERYAEKRLNPALLLEETRSVIALLINYYPPELIPHEDNFILSKYAYGKDYPSPIRKKMENLIHFMQAESPALKAKAFVDSGPVLEKLWAQRSGIGWQGKHSLIINQHGGSFFFIGIILTNLELEADPPETDHCGNCDRCIRACPTGALERPYQLNIPRCIANLTIEQKSEIPAAFKGKMQDRIYGCDICQDVCPYNRFSEPHEEPEFMPSAILKQMRKKDWLALTEEQFKILFTGSPVARLGYQRLMSNIRFCHDPENNG